MLPTTRRKGTPGIGSRPRAAAGFTLIELLVVIAIIAVLSSIAITYLYSVRQKAHEITAHHDLNAFVQAQQALFSSTDRFAGVAGQSLREDPGASDFSLEGFRASPGVVITVVSGDPEAPYDEAAPFVVQARHRSAPKIFEYDFASGRTTER